MGDALVFVGAGDGVVGEKVGGTLGLVAEAGGTAVLGAAAALEVADALAGAGAALALLLDAAGWLAWEVPN